MRISAVAITVLAATSGPVWAQEKLPGSETPRASGADVQEVVVTAQKTGAQSLQAVPLAIQAFSGADLKEKNITSIDDLVSSVPGAFEGQQQSVASRSYNLRGAGGSNANGDSPIGYYLDDVPFIVTNFGIAPRCASSTLNGWKSCAARRAPCTDRDPRGAHSYSIRAIRTSRK